MGAGTVSSEVPQTKKIIMEIGNVIVFPNSVRFLCIREAAAGWLAGRLRQTLSGKHEKCENFRQSRLRHYYGNSARFVLRMLAIFWE